ncbi:MAG TPA: hypothetical protein VN132_15775 [Bdellovibrio sp.]|nr:hypothetical protein [Bdellovibrio sp.]
MINTSALVNVNVTCHLRGKPNGLDSSQLFHLRARTELVVHPGGRTGSTSERSQLLASANGVEAFDVGIVETTAKRDRATRIPEQLILLSKNGKHFFYNFGNRTLVTQNGIVYQCE